MKPEEQKTDWIREFKELIYEYNRQGDPVLAIDTVMESKLQHFITQERLAAKREVVSELELQVNDILWDVNYHDSIGIFTKNYSSSKLNLIKSNIQDLKRQIDEEVVSL